jgi:hypothetical protein
VLLGDRKEELSVVREPSDRVVVGDRRTLELLEAGGLAHRGVFSFETQDIAGA